MRAGRQDLIGFGPKCLIRPYPPKPAAAGARPGARKGTGKKGSGSQAPGTKKGASGKKPAAGQRRKPSGPRKAK